ncbi:SDR family NAD(P)-dependent oxidoreductase [Novosphingobium sp.]|uniref:SDR family NAD(P)-dependent oxidoreductase n=1 Tax=Novosphingobium sp. TaxID=1874826 RepID=UPI0038B987ED
MARNYIVTGGFGALGRAVCSELLSAGHRVVAMDIASPPGGFTVNAIGQLDLADERAVAEGYAKAEQMLGGIDGVVNVAGGFLWETLADGTIRNWERMLSMNLLTAAISCKAALAHLRPGGSIVNIGAAAASNTATGMAPYAASKAGVMALTEGLSAELSERNIRVNAVLPTIIDTPKNREDMPEADFSAWVQPAAAAKAIAFLLSSDSSAINGAGIKLSTGR